MSVVVENLIKQYGAQKAVNKISFQVNAGEIVGFLGPNGAGKSTTMKIATGYVPPTSGTVVVDGYDVTTQPLKVREQVGYLPEHNPLYLDMYVTEYLQFIAGLHKLSSKQIKERTALMIELTGLEKERKKKIGALSKGYRQRVGLAQALVHNPSVLILDEPTTGLDPNQIVEIRNVIKNVSKEKTVILSTHIMQEVQALCSRVIIINSGEIVANNPIAQLQSTKSKGFVVSVEFSEAINENDFESLNLKKIELLEKNTYRFYAHTADDPRIAIFNIAAKNNTPIISMNLEADSLESVFQKLTK